MTNLTLKWFVFSVCIHMSDNLLTLCEWLFVSIATFPIANVRRFTRLNVFLYDMVRQVFSTCEYIITRNTSIMIDPLTNMSTMFIITIALRSLFFHFGDFHVFWNVI